MEFGTVMILILLVQYFVSSQVWIFLGQKYTSSPTNSWSVQQDKMHHLICSASGPWHSVPRVLSSFMSLILLRDFLTVHGYQRIFYDTLGGQNSARSWILSFKPGSSGLQHSQMALFFHVFFFYLIADIFRFVRFQKTSYPLWECWKPLEFRVLALESQEQLSCDMCLLCRLLSLWVHFIPSYTWWSNKIHLIQETCGRYPRPHMYGHCCCFAIVLYSITVRFLGLGPSSCLDE